MHPQTLRQYDRLGLVVAAAHGGQVPALLDARRRAAARGRPARRRGRLARGHPAHPRAREPGDGAAVARARARACPRRRAASPPRRPGLRRGRERRRPAPHGTRPSRQTSVVLYRAALSVPDSDRAAPCAERGARRPVTRSVAGDRLRASSAGGPTSRPPNSSRTTRPTGCCSTRRARRRRRPPRRRRRHRRPSRRPHPRCVAASSIGARASASTRTPSPASSRSPPTPDAGRRGRGVAAPRARRALVAGARVVLLQLPRGLDALDEIAERRRGARAPRRRVVAGGSVKHMTPAMNERARPSLRRRAAGLARQKSRVLTATTPTAGDPDGPAGRARVAPRRPRSSSPTARRSRAPRVDVGTRSLLGLPRRRARRRPRRRRPRLRHRRARRLLALAPTGARVVATDQSWAAVASARGHGRRQRRRRPGDRRARRRRSPRSPTAPPTSCCSTRRSTSGATVHAGIAHKLFDAAARVLRPGGELWTVWNSPPRLPRGARAHRRPHAPGGPERQVHGDGLDEAGS